MFSFIIRIKNEGEELENTLNCILNQKCTEEIEVVIVDSGSTDNSLDIARAYGCKILEISPNEFSWGKALNLGIENANGDKIIVLSGHCMLTNDNTLISIKEYLQNHQNVGVIYGRQIGVIEKDPFEYVDNYDTYPETKPLLINYHSEFVRVFSNACAFFLKKIWEDIKFDEKLQSCEDAMWALEVMKNNINIVYLPAFSVYHGHNLDLDYLYRKSYCREKELFILRNERKSRIWYFLKFLIKHLSEDARRYINSFRSQRINISFADVLIYCYIKNSANYHASTDGNNCTNYSKVGIPVFKKLKLKSRDFCD